MTLDFPMSFCKSLLKDEKNLLEELKKYVSYEIAIGHNGKYFFFVLRFEDLLKKIGFG